jgi:hypothetical protein
MSVDELIRDCPEKLIQSGRERRISEAFNILSIARFFVNTIV